MKVLMTTDTVGGVWSYCIELIRQLQTFDVEVCLAAKGEPGRHQLRELARLDNVRLESQPFALEWMPDPWDDVARASEWLMELAAVYQPAVVHLNDYAHGHLPWSAPVLVVGHSCVCSWLAAVRQQSPGPEWQRYQHEVRSGLQAADAVVAPSQWMLGQLQRFYGPLTNTAVIYNGCNAGEFQSTRSKQSTVFAAGRWWDPAKNLPLLEDVAPAIQWPLSIAGSNTLDQHDDTKNDTDRVIVQTTAQHHLKHLGKLSRPAMVTHYASSSIFAHPALYEPFGLTVLEAALSRCALVISDLASLREIWQEAAIYVAPHDACQWASTINQLIEDPRQREEMARRAYERGLQFSSRAMAQSYMAAYQQCVQAHTLRYINSGSHR